MFAERFKLLREERKLSQSEIAKNFDLSPSAIGMYEQGRRTPDPLSLKKIADYFGVSTDYLIGATDIRNIVGVVDELEQEFPEGIQVLRQASKKLTPEEKKKMVKLIKVYIEEDE